jgi:hypothetical protein
MKSEIPALCNCTLTSGKPHYSYKKPFDIIAEGVVSVNWLMISKLRKTLQHCPETLW